MVQLSEAGMTRGIVSERTVVSEHFPFVNRSFVKSGGKQNKTKKRPLYHGHVVLNH